MSDSEIKSERVIDACSLDEMGRVSGGKVVDDDDDDRDDETVKGTASGYF